MVCQVEAFWRVWDRSLAPKNEAEAMLMLKVGVIFGNGKRLRAPSPVSDFMLGWGWLSWSFKQGLWRKLSPPG